MVATHLKGFMKLVLAACWILVLSFGIGHATELPLVVQCRNKPPYSFTKDGKPSGFLIERTAEILKLAGIQASLQEVPVTTVPEIQAAAVAVAFGGGLELSRPLSRLRNA